MPVAGEAPTGEQAAALREVQVVFAAAAPDPAVRGPDLSQPISEAAAGRRPSGCEGSGKGGSSRGRVVYHRPSQPGTIITAELPSCMLMAIHTESNRAQTAALRCHI